MNFSQWWIPTFILSFVPIFMLKCAGMLILSLGAWIISKVDQKSFQHSKQSYQWGFFLSDEQSLQVWWNFLKETCEKQLAYMEWLCPFPPKIAYRLQGDHQFLKIDWKGESKSFFASKVSPVHQIALLATVFTVKRITRLLTDRLEIRKHAFITKYGWNVLTTASEKFSNPLWAPVFDRKVCPVQAAFEKPEERSSNKGGSDNYTQAERQTKSLLKGSQSVGQDHS